MSFVIWNLVLYTLRRFRKIGEGLLKFIEIIRNLPVIDATIIFWQWIFGTMAQSAKEIKEEKERENKKIEDLTKTVVKLSTALKEVGKGIDRTQREWADDAKRWRHQVETSLRKPPTIPANFSSPSHRNRGMERQGESSAGRRPWRESRSSDANPVVCNFCDFRGHSENQCWQKIYIETGEDKSEGTVQCSYCPLKGHKAEGCVLKKREEKMD